MSEDVSHAPKRRRWFRFSLRTMFVAVAILGTAGYWAARQAAFARAQHNYEYAYGAWQAEAILTEEVCKASLHLYNTEVAVPFADRGKAAASHLERMKWVVELAYGDNSEWLMGVSDDASLAEARARKAKIEDYYAEAKRMVAD
jgi:hypothetical protein